MSLLAKDTERAASAFRQVLRIIPDDFEALVHLGLIHYNRGDSEGVSCGLARLHSATRRPAFRAAKRSATRSRHAVLANVSLHSDTPRA